MDLRKLQHTKAKQIKVDSNPPINSDGQNGDMQLIRSSNLNNNELLYIKINSEWKIIGLEDRPDFGSQRTVPNIEKIKYKDDNVIDINDTSLTISKPLILNSTLNVTGALTVDDITINGSTITDAGALTIDGLHGFTSPNTPCFSAYNSATDADLVNDETLHTIDFDTEVFDIGGNFASDTFTAPVAGKYFFTSGVTVVQQDVDVSVRMQILTSGGTFDSWGWQHQNASNYTTHTVSCLVHLTASQTAKVRVAAKADTDDDFDIVGGATNTYFQGYRVA